LGRNKHSSNQISGGTFDYMKDILQVSTRRCPRKSCGGTLVNVWVQYDNKGPVNFEQECTFCGKTVRDPQYQKNKLFISERKCYENR